MPQWLHLRTPSRDTVLYPAISYPDLRHGCHAGRLPGGARRRRRPVPHRPVVDRAVRRRAGPVPVGQHAGQPGRRARRPRRGRGLGSGPRGPGAERRVLRRVHLDRAAPHRSSSTAATACWPSTRSPSGRTWPAPGSGFYAGDPELVDFLAEARKHAGFMVAGPGAGRGRGRVGRRRPRRGPAGSLPGSARAHGRRSSATGVSTPRSPTAASTSGCPAPDGDAWALAERLADGPAGVASPGEFYGPAGSRPRPPGHGAARRRARAGGRPTGRGLSPTGVAPVRVCRQRPVSLGHNGSVTTASDPSWGGTLPGGAGRIVAAQATVERRLSGSA